MSLALFERVLAAFNREDYQIAVIEYCGQGEPLSNARFSEFVSIARRYFPATQQYVITNGNYDYQAAFKGEWVDELIVSCDGAIQANYEQYRIGGDINLVFRFMKDAVSRSPQTRVIWKYILFEYNDSEEEILLAQKIAEDLGVFELRFVLTGTCQRSKRYHAGNIDGLPRRDVRLSIALHPGLTQMDQVAHGAVQGIDDKWIGCVDYFGSATDCATRYLVIEGWILWQGKKFGALECIINEEKKGETTAWVRRPDVIESFPQYPERSSCGFRFIVPIGERLPYAVALEIRAKFEQTSMPALRGIYSVSSLVVDVRKAPSDKYDSARDARVSVLQKIDGQTDGDLLFSQRRSCSPKEMIIALTKARKADEDLGPA